jgi:mannose-6-phosphate isomerase-like protein (cupin superfamily)
MTDIIQKPWGYYQNLYSKEHVFLTKLIVINPLQRTSLQKHALRKEILTVVSGNGLLYFENDLGVIDSKEIQLGDVIHIERGRVHRLCNNSSIDTLVIIETQLGDCFENDILRIEDDYSRA